LTELGVADFAVVTAYAVAVVAIGVAAARRHAGDDDLLLADRGMPTWAVLLSMIATELSAATFIGVPVAAFHGDWSYLQLAVGALAGKLVLAAHVIPLYHRRGVVTVYEFLETGAGHATRRAAAAAFAGGRVLASGVRLFIAALAFSLVTGLSIEATIVVCGLVALAYTAVGGIRSVIYTDALQGAVFVVAAIALVVGVTAAEGGPGALLSWASAEGKTRVFTWQPLFDVRANRGFGTAAVGGFFLTLATHATDHDMVQRLLTARSGRAGGRALAVSGLLNFPLTLLFLFIGTGLARFYFDASPEGLASTDQIVPWFALHELPTGLRGLVFAGLFAAAMSSLDSAVCAIAATWVRDVAPNAATQDAEAHDPDTARRVRRVSVCVGLALIGAALVMARVHASMQSDSNAPGLIEFALSSMSILYGGLLGIFARGWLLPRYGGDRSGVAALVCGGTIGFFLFFHPTLFGETHLAWTYWIPASAIMTFAIACLPGRRIDRSPE
jgi:SSS family transporter